MYTFTSSPPPRPSRTKNVLNKIKEESTHNRKNSSITTGKKSENVLKEKRFTKEEEMRWHSSTITTVSFVIQEDFFPSSQVSQLTNSLFVFLWPTTMHAMVMPKKKKNLQRDLGLYFAGLEQKSSLPRGG